MTVKKRKTKHEIREEEPKSDEPVHYVITNTAWDEKKDDEWVMTSPSYPDNDVIGFEEPMTLLKKYKVYTNRPVRVYCDGIYDLFHYGHARSLKQAKNLFPNTVLVVGVPSDRLTLSLKGKTVLVDSERIESLKHCRYVDEIIGNAPWVITNEFLEKYKIDYVAHDDAPYAGNGSSDIYAPIKALNKFVPTKRTLGVSTTGIITMIVKDYDRYVRRNLERGISAKDLNLGLFKKLDYEVQRKIDILGENMKTELDKIRGEIQVAFDYWENMSNVWVSNFIEKFGKIGKNKLWDKIRERVRKEA